jgi:hypothetical protein
MLKKPAAVSRSGTFGKQLCPVGERIRRTAPPRPYNEAGALAPQLLPWRHYLIKHRRVRCGGVRETSLETAQPRRAPLDTAPLPGPQFIIMPGVGGSPDQFGWRKHELECQPAHLTGLHCFRPSRCRCLGPRSGAEVDSSSHKASFGPRRSPPQDHRRERCNGHRRQRLGRAGDRVFQPSELFVPAKVRLSAPQPQSRRLVAPHEPELVDHGLQLEQMFLISLRRLLVLRE